MRLLIQPAMIFFGTLMAAGLPALGAPRNAVPAAAQRHHGPEPAPGASFSEPGSPAPPRR